MKTNLSSPAKPAQENKFIERRITEKRKVSVLGYQFIALKNVYDTGTDTELMADVVQVNKSQTFLEIGCGIGAVSLLVGMRAKKGLGVDINPDAIENANLNKKLLKIGEVEFKLSNIFENVNGKFDVIIWNPPYSAFKPKDEVEMMFWDENNKMKIRFFDEVKNFLNTGGRIYFGWADFEDIDQKFPDEQAKRVGLKFMEKYSRKNKDEDRIYFVYLFEL